jgi:hypothetical protein
MARNNNNDNETLTVVRDILYGVHLPNDTLSIAFEIAKENATVSIGSVLKWRSRSHHQ